MRRLMSSTKWPRTRTGNKTHISLPALCAAQSMHTFCCAQTQKHARKRLYSICKISAQPHRAFAFLRRKKKTLLNERDSQIHVCVCSLAEFAFIFKSQTLWFFPSSHQGAPCLFMAHSLHQPLGVYFTPVAGAAARALQWLHVIADQSRES